MNRPVGAGGPVLVRSPVSGRPLACCWDDCTRYGDDRVQIRVREGVKEVTMIFCSERHRQYHLHSTRDYGGLPPGYRLTLI